mmetsp:Transcript_16014/g.24002  ORF Transcript_16014/g.24002 Transcript_16014/m.24002 type:complete len:313 (-) Transcript_16014:26-964(-)
MAANDDYINSQGLNVKRNHNDFKEKKSTDVSMGCSRGKALGNLTEERGHNVEKHTNQNNYALLDSVAEVMKGSQEKIEKKARSGMSNNGNIETNTKLASSQDDDSIDSDEENDPIMRMIGGQRRQVLPLERKRDFIDLQAQSLQDDLAVDHLVDLPRKDPNRFIADLDERISRSDHFNGCKGVTGTDDVETSAMKPIRFDIVDMFGQTSNKMQWLREATGFTTKNAHILIPTKEEETSNEGDEEAQTFQVQSSTLLGNDENANAELERIRKRMNTTAVTYLLREFTISLGSCLYLGIFVTFCLTSIYFFKLM